MLVGLMKVHHSAQCCFSGSKGIISGKAKRKMEEILSEKERAIARAREMFCKVA
jgi:hypothetical protein